MRSELRTALMLLAIFAAVAIVVGLVVDFDSEDVRLLLEASRERPELAFALVVGLLAVDSVLAVPTISTVLAAGYLLGPGWGALASFAGMMSAGSICYWGGRLWGASRWLKGRTVADVLGGDREREVGAAILLVARAAPMLPEISSALAGARRMRVARYYFYFGLGNLPFAVLLAYAGSVSTLERPWPAIAAALVVPIAGAAFMLWRRLARRPASSG